MIQLGIILLRDLALLYLSGLYQATYLMTRFQRVSLQADYIGSPSGVDCRHVISDKVCHDTAFKERIFPTPRLEVGMRLAGILGCSAARTLHRKSQLSTPYMTT